MAGLKNPSLREQLNSWQHSFTALILFVSW